MFGQIADPGAAGYRPEHFPWQAFIEPQEFTQRMEAADFVVAHAGMGSIITALTLAKPLVVMPRRVELGEHRNDHQAATAERFAARPGVVVAADERQLPGILDDMARGTDPSGGDPVSSFAEARLLGVLKAFIRGEDER